MRVSKNLLFHAPHPFDQLAVVLPNLTRGPLRTRSTPNDSDPRFTSAFRMSLFKIIQTTLLLSTDAHPETDGQIEYGIWVLEDVPGIYATPFKSWSSYLSFA